MKTFIADIPYDPRFDPQEVKKPSPALGIGVLIVVGGVITGVLLKDKKDKKKKADK